jgi:hypothetical protein
MDSPSPEVLARRFCHPFSMRPARRGLGSAAAEFPASPAVAPLDWAWGARHAWPPPPGCSGSGATTRVHTACTGYVLSLRGKGQCRSSGQARTL